MFFSHQGTEPKTDRERARQTERERERERETDGQGETERERETGGRQAGRERVNLWHCIKGVCSI